MKTLIWIIVLALVAWGVYALVDRDGDNLQPTTNDTQQGTDSTATTTDSSGAAGGIELAVREFTVSGKNFSFAPATMRVNEGEKVRITFKNDSGTHDLVVEGYNARTKILQAGQSETIEFLADKTGTFEYYCSVGTHRQQGMKGTLIVDEWVEQ